VRDAVENVLLLTDIESPRRDKKLTEAFREGDAVSQMQAMARFLAECPHNILDCETFVRVLMKLTDTAKALGNSVEIEIHGSETADRRIPITGSLESLNLNVLKAVHQGSVHESGPFMVRIKYRGAEGGAGPVDAAVFKCIMQDNGGHCAKGEHAEDMQGDMAAGATGAAIFAKCAEEKPKKNIDFVFAIASNTADAHAYEVNDVLQHASGVTTEILNTDAEGRLAVADCLGATLQLHNREGSETGKITAMATLTGHSTLIGANSTQVYSHSRARLRDIEERSIRTGEPYQGMRLMPIDAKAIEGSKTTLRNLAIMPGPRGVTMRGSQVAAEYIRLAAGIDKRRGDFVEFDIATALRAVKHGTPADIKHNRFPMDFIDTAYEYLVAA
jgi:leucyl aminopeptidase